MLTVLRLLERENILASFRPADLARHHDLYVMVTLRAPVGHDVSYLMVVAPLSVFVSHRRRTELFIPFVTADVMLVLAVLVVHWGT